MYKFNKYTMIALENTFQLFAQKKNFQVFAPKNGGGGAAIRCAAAAARKHIASTIARVTRDLFQKCSESVSESIFEYEHIMSFIYIWP